VAVRIRLSRIGRKKVPGYRLVVADSRSKRDGRVIEIVGHYNPRDDRSALTLKRERVDYWLEKGALPTETVAVLLKKASRAAQASKSS